MSRVVLLDAGPLGMVAHPRKNPDVKAWMERLIRGGVVVAVSEIADYEVRRELLRADKPKSIRRLDTLKAALRYLPITTEVMLQAAAFWAQMRQQGTPLGPACAIWRGLCSQSRGRILCERVARQGKTWRQYVSECVDPAPIHL